MIADKGASMFEPCDVSAWLDYDEHRTFRLSSGETAVSFAETVVIPLMQIKETVDRYAEKIKSVLGEYRGELMAFRIETGQAESDGTRIAEMETALEDAGNAGDKQKAKGIAKGIESLKKKAGEQKKTTVWDKVMGDIAAFQQLKNDVFAAQSQLALLEAKMDDTDGNNSLSGPEVMEIKKRMTDIQEDLRKKFALMDQRIEGFKNNLVQVLSPAIGEDRAQAVEQEIQEGLHEEFAHFSNGRTVLAGLFSGKQDKEKKRLENNPMSIFIWSRNPDIDLYQGNYSPCCVSIERGSGYSKHESAIADYFADLGMQVVNIWDEAKKEPVAAAWCFVSQDKKGDPVLVVDNVESNEHFSLNYPEQLSRELFGYLERYAKKVGAKKLVLGKDNNDLPLAAKLEKLPSDNNKYKKTGGYNRKDGYFLEAEEETTKIIWASEHIKDKKTFEFRADF